MLPFSLKQFLAVFAAYNGAIWPAQIVAYVLGLIAVAALFRPSRTSDRIIASVLAAMWLWTGFVYHVLFFATINNAAYGFGGLFLLQGAFIALAGIGPGQLRFGFRPRPVSWVGVAFVLYAMILYPAIGLGTGHAYPEMPMFGVTPCPVTIFTLGLFLLTNERFSRWLLVIPIIWSLIGGSAAILLGVAQDWLLLVSGAIAVTMLLLRDRAAPYAATAA